MCNCGEDTCVCLYPTEDEAFDILLSENVSAAMLPEPFQKDYILHKWKKDEQAVGAGFKCCSCGVESIDGLRPCECMTGVGYKITDKYIKHYIFKPKPIDHDAMRTEKLKQRERLAEIAYYARDPAIKMPEAAPWHEQDEWTKDYFRRIVDAILEARNDNG